MIAEALSINQRPYIRPQIDIESAPFWCFPGRAIFATPKHDEQLQRESGLLLTNQTAHINRLPVATCIRASHELECSIDNEYIVHQARAKYVRDVRIGNWSFMKDEGQLWLFGCHSPRKGECGADDPNDWLFCELTDRPAEIWQTEECPFKLRPISVDLKATDSITWKNGKRVVAGTCILGLPEPKKEKNGLVLPDDLQEWPDMAVVLSASPSCKTAKPGMVVWYQRAGLHGWGHLPELRFASIHEHAIFAAVNV